MRTPPWQAASHAGHTHTSGTCLAFQWTSQSRVLHQGLPQTSGPVGRNPEAIQMRTAHESYGYAIVRLSLKRNRGYERANSSSDFTSFSLASSVRSAARYLVRASPCVTRSFPAPQLNSALPYFTATTSAIIRA